MNSSRAAPLSCRGRSMGVAMALQRICVGVVAILLAHSVRGFEVDTHAQITGAGVARSALQESPDLLFDLGVRRGIVYSKQFPTYFEHIPNSSAIARFVNQPHDLEVLGVAEWRNTVAEWIMEGANREDDINEPDDPTIGPSRVRVINHFFDPRSKAPLTVPFGNVFDNPLIPPTDIVAIGSPNPGWALGLVNANHFTIPSAREAQYRALTGRSGTGATLATDQQGRNLWWATAFRALGDVVHLLQDMAQPQHTRNDAHAGSVCPDGVSQPCGLLIGHASVFESYVNARALQALPSFWNPHQGCLPDATVAALPLNVPYADTGQPYPVPKFKQYSDYWFNASGAGLADFSNGNFLTAGSNIGALFPYPIPSQNPDAYIRRSVAVPLDPCLPPGATSEKQLLWNVIDRFTGINRFVPVTTEGVLSSGNATRYTLTRRNYDAMIDELIPRAVSYTAGVLNHFFRGKLEISAPPGGVYAVTDTALATSASPLGFKTLRLHVKNVTDPLPIPQQNVVPQNWAIEQQDLNGGTLIAIARFHRNNCHVDGDLSGEYGSPGKSAESCRATTFLASAGVPEDHTDLAEEIVVSKPIVGFSLAAGASTSSGPSPNPLAFDFTDQPIPLGVSDLYIQLVYRGQLGSEEDAIVVATKDVSEPTYLTWVNSLDYVQYDDIVYSRAEVAQNLDGVLARTSPSFCVTATSPPTLRDLCFQPEDLTMSLVATGATTPLINVSGLTAQGYFRVALLLDADSNFKMTDVTGNCKINAPVLNAKRDEWLYQARVPTFTYAHSAIGTFRGQLVWGADYCVWDGQQRAGDLPRPQNLQHMVALPSNGAPVPVQIDSAYLP